MALDVNSGSSLDNFAPSIQGNANVLVDEVTRELLGNRANGPVGLAIHGSTASLFKTTNAVKIVVGGKWVALGAQSSIAASSLASYVVPVSSTAYFGVWADASGTISLSPSLLASFPVIDRATSTSSGRRVQKCFLGYVKVVTDGTHTFTPGTTAFDATGVTTTFVDCAYVPDPADL